MQPWSIDAYRRLRQHNAERGDVAGKNLFLSIHLQSTAMEYLLGLALETQRRGTTIVVSLHAHAAEHGGSPDSLQEVDMRSETVRIDPYSGQGFVYKLLDGKPLLYSVGLDGKDNGGTHDDHALLSERAEGHDFVFLPAQDEP